MNIYIYIY